jgi:hypothetical protein
MEDRDDPEHWRKRAEKMRVMAAQKINEGSRYILLLAAESDDMMAELAERRRGALV